MKLNSWINDDRNVCGVWDCSVKCFCAADGDIFCHKIDCGNREYHDNHTENDWSDDHTRVHDDVWQTSLYDGDAGRLICHQCSDD